MKKITMELIKEMLIGGLRKNNYDILKMQLGPTKNRLFLNRDDLVEAVRHASMMLSSWQSQTRSGSSSFPSKPDEMERYIELQVADLSALDALTWINSPLSRRSNRELIIELRETIELLKTLGADGRSKASSYELMLEQKINQ